MRIYLSGPIDNVSVEEATGWREKLKNKYRSVTMIDPTRRDWSDVDIYADDFEVGDIVNPDLADISSCDALLVNLNSDKLVGTAMEIIYAVHILKPIVCISDEKYKISPWITFHTDEFVSTPEEGLKWLMDWYDGGVNCG